MPPWAILRPRPDPSPLPSKTGGALSPVPALKQLALREGPTTGQTRGPQNADCYPPGLSTHPTLSPPPFLKSACPLVPTALTSDLLPSPQTPLPSPQSSQRTTSAHTYSEKVEKTGAMRLEPQALPPSIPRASSPPRCDKGQIFPALVTFSGPQSFPNRPGLSSISNVFLLSQTSQIHPLLTTSSSAIRVRVIACCLLAALCFHPALAHPPPYSRSGPLRV